MQTETKFWAILEQLEADLAAGRITLREYRRAYDRACLANGFILTTWPPDDDPRGD